MRGGVGVAEKGRRGESRSGAALSGHCGMQQRMRDARGDGNADGAMSSGEEGVGR